MATNGKLRLRITNRLQLLRRGYHNVNSHGHSSTNFTTAFGLIKPFSSLQILSDYLITYTAYISCDIFEAEDVQDLTKFMNVITICPNTE